VEQKLEEEDNEKVEFGPPKELGKFED